MLSSAVASHKTDPLQSIINMSTYIDKLSSLFMSIGRSAPRQSALAVLYPQSKQLQSYLAEYFIVVIEFCQHLFKFGQKSAIQQFATSLNESRLQEFQANLDKWACCISEETSFVDLQEKSGFRVLSKSFFKLNSEHQSRLARIRVLEYCSTYDHEMTWKQIRKAGNTTSYGQSADYKAWRMSTESKALIFKGTLGSGKSVALANIVDDLNLFATQEQHPVAFFFCKHDVAASLMARTIVGSLARQLLSHVQDLSKISRSCEDTHIIGNAEKVVELFVQVFPSDKKAFIVIDGIDECSSSEKDELLQSIGRLMEAGKFLVCISRREELDHEFSVTDDSFFRAGTMSSLDNSSDIEDFIEADLERCLRQGLLNIRRPELILEIRTALSEGAQGMFLWAALQLQALCCMKSDHAIENALKDLPKDLSQTFARILQNAGTSDQQLQTKTLRVILAARRPLTTDELCEALGVVAGDAEWNPSRILNDIDSALACCGCLLVVDEEDKAVRVVHHSVKQYLLSSLHKVDGVRFTLDDAWQTLADIVVTYLSYDVFDTQLSTVRVRPLVAQSAPSRVLRATLEPSTTRYLALKLLELRRQPAFDMSAAVAKARNTSPSESDTPFKFLAYSKSHWLQHVFYVSGESMMGLGEKLVNSPISDTSNSNEDLWTSFQWALDHDNATIVLALLLTHKIETEKVISKQRLLVRVVKQHHIGDATATQLNLADLCRWANQVGQNKLSDLLVKELVPQFHVG